MYLRYRLSGSSEGWIFEEEMRLEQRRNKERLPDAILEGTNGTKIIEFGGALTPKRKSSFSTNTVPIEHSRTRLGEMENTDSLILDHLDLYNAWIDALLTIRLTAAARATRCNA